MRVLIADPDLHDCWSARLLLSHAGHEVVVATTSVASAVSLAREAEPELCLVGALPAGPDGAEVAEAIWSEIGAPCLLIGEGGTASAPAALACLARPFGALELLEAVEICESLLRREAPPARVDRLTRLTLFTPEGEVQ